MKFTRRTLMVAAALVATAGGAVTGIQTASADTGSATPTGKVVIEATGAYTGALVNGLTIAADCTAVAEGAVSAIVIDKCYLTNQTSYHPSTAPGNATTSVFTTTESTLNFQLCWHAYAIPLTDPLHPATASGCATGLLPGGLGGGGISEGSN